MAASGFGRCVGARAVAQAGEVLVSVVELVLGAVVPFREVTRIALSAAFVAALVIGDRAGGGADEVGGRETGGAFACVALRVAGLFAAGEIGRATCGRIEGRCVAVGACVEPVGRDVGLIVAAWVGFASGFAGLVGTCGGSVAAGIGRGELDLDASEAGSGRAVYAIPRPRQRLRVSTPSSHPCHRLIGD